MTVASPFIEEAFDAEELCPTAVAVGLGPTGLQHMTDRFANWEANGPLALASGPT